MASSRRIALAAVIVLSVVGCERAKLGKPESVVGASDLPPSGELAGETIQVNRGRGYGEDRHYLSYELRPDNRLRITHSLDGFDGKDVVGKESFQLSGELALRLRETFWRMRPSKLRRVEYLECPVGCEPPIDSGMEVAVAFFGQHDKIGIFALPYACKDGQAAVARAAMNEAMALLPRSKVAKAFPDAS